jgi:hypothetical protein
VGHRHGSGVRRSNRTFPTPIVHRYLKEKQRMMTKLAIAIGLAVFPLGAVMGNAIGWDYDPCTLHYDPDALQDFPYDCYGACYGGDDCYIAGSPSDPDCAL